jgi:hypothetical protein
MVIPPGTNGQKPPTEAGFPVPTSGTADMGRPRTPWALNEQVLRPKPWSCSWWWWWWWWKHNFEVWTKINSNAKIIIYFATFFAWFATRWLWWYDCQRALVDESGIFPYRYHFTMILNSLISPAGWTIGLLLAAVQRHILTPLTWSSSIW